MKSQIFKRLALAATLISLVFVVTNVSAKKPIKPPPDPDQTTAECIVFTGYLEGVEEIEGCCPNAGPWPAYTMAMDGTNYDGQLFINFVGSGPKAQYKVQFWSWDYDTETPGDGDAFFEIVGGEIDYDRKSKFLMVAFEGEEATLWLYGVNPPIVETHPTVSFELVRTSNLSYCE